MQSPGRPANENLRLQRLRDLQLLDTGPESLIDGFTGLAATVTGMDVALVSLVDDERQWAKSALGVPQGTQAPRALSFCAHAICGEGLFEVEDARRDPRFAAHPLVAGAPHVAHYAGVPLMLPGGEAVGTLCVLDPRPGRLDARQRTALAGLADSLVQVLLLREREASLDRQRLLRDAAEYAELAPVGMFSADVAGNVVHGNLRWAAMLGAGSVAEMSGQGWQAYIHPEELAQLVAGWHEALAGSTDYAGVFRTRPGPDGGVRWVKFRVRPADARLAPVAFVGTTVDVSETVRLEQELQRQNQRLGLAMEASGLGLWEQDLTTGAIFLSEGWARLLQVAAPDGSVDPDQVLRFVPAHELARIRAARRQLLKGEIPRLSLEHQMHGAEGALVWLLTEAQVIARDAAGRALKVVGTSKDITDRKVADAALRRAVEAADQASHAKSEFLATMSHEIRTPLNGVIGLTQLLAGADLPPMESDSVAMIDSCAKSLLSLVDNILDISRIEAGKLNLDFVPTDLVRLVQETGDVFSVRAGEKGIRFDMRREPNVPQWVRTDPGRLRQILLNLLGNALKFTPEGGFSLRVYTQQAASGTELCFGVFDTGIGISQEDQQRLFARFSQAGAGSGRPQGGTGLGLAISRELAHLMGGEITVASRKDHGSTFTLRIPLQPCEPPAAVKAHARATVPTDARILLAEDNEVNQLVARRMLSRLGYGNVTTVVTGREAVDICTRERFDLVLMDCQMPVMDGWEATRQLRQLGVRLPILAFTANATSADLDRCMAAGMDDFVGKPIEVTVLADKLQRWLAAAAPAPAPAPAAPAAAPAPQAFDRGTLDRLFLGDMVLFAEAHEMFVEQTRPTLQGLLQGPLEREALRRAMHRLRGSAGTIGARWLAELSLEIEQDTASSEDELRLLLQEACAAFEAFVKESSPVLGR